MITPIQRLGTISSVEQAGGVSQPRVEGGSPFASVFQSAVQAVKETDADMVQAQYLLATGQLDNPAAVTIAATKNEIAVNLLVQLRNKALDAYSELTRMNL